MTNVDIDNIMGIKLSLSPIIKYLKLLVIITIFRHKTTL